MAVAPDGISSIADASSRGDGDIDNIEQSCPEVILEIGVFFDGTLNNEANVEAGREVTPEPGSSYANELTNVVHLKNHYFDSGDDLRNSCGDWGTRYRPLYVDGIGTAAGHEDSTLGYAIGMGPRGVSKKAYDTAAEVGRYIGNLSPGVEPQKVILDVFGFSRGAAAARYFVNGFNQGYMTYWLDLIRSRQFVVPPGRNVEIRFVGLFETVAAIGWDAHGDENAGVNIHLKSSSAQKVFHLVGTDEFRHNFSLNEVLPGGGEQLEMPGAHSDVGGGYRAGTESPEIFRPEEFTFFTRRAALNAQAQKTAEVKWGHVRASQWLVDEGWIEQNDLANAIQSEPTQVVSVRSLAPIPQFKFRVHTRFVRDVGVGLEKIGLNIMHKKAKDNSVPLKQLPNLSRYAVPSDLASVKVVLENGGQLSDAQKGYVKRHHTHYSSHWEKRSGFYPNKPAENRIRARWPNRPGEAK